MCKAPYNLSTLRRVTLELHCMTPDWCVPTSSRCAPGVRTAVSVARLTHVAVQWQGSRSAGSRRRITTSDHDVGSSNLQGGSVGRHNVQDHRRPDQPVCLSHGHVFAQPAVRTCETNSSALKYSQASTIDAPSPKFVTYDEKI